MCGVMMLRLEKIPRTESDNAQAPILPILKSIFHSKTKTKKQKNLFPFSYKMFSYFLQREKMKEYAIKIFFHIAAENKHTQKPFKCCHSSSCDFFANSSTELWSNYSFLAYVMKVVAPVPWSFKNSIFI